MKLEHFALGTPVRVAESCPYYGDWAQDLLWIAGVVVKPGGTEILYTVSFAWPPRDNGDLTTDFHPDHLTER